MSRIIAAVVLSLMLIGLCIADRMVVNKTYTEMYEDISACEAAVEQKDVYEKTKIIKKNWEDREGVLSIFVNHDILDEIGTSIARLEALAEESHEDYLSECAVIKMKLDYIKKDSGINMHSVF